MKHWNIHGLMRFADSLFFLVTASAVLDDIMMMMFAGSGPQRRRATSIGGESPLRFACDNPTPASIRRERGDLELNSDPDAVIRGYTGWLYPDENGRGRL